MGSPPHSFSFVIRIYRFSDNSTDFVREINERFPNYRSREIVVVGVPITELGEEYQFAAQATNIFGTSQQSALSKPIFLNYSGDFQQDMHIINNIGSF